MSEIETKGEIEIVAKAVEVKLIELNLKPGAKLAMIAPEDWTPRQIALFGEYFNAALKFKGYNFELLIFPHGSELLSVTPSGGVE